MATLPTPQAITFSQIQGGTTARLEANRKDVMTYLAIFIPATAIASYLDTSLGLISSSGDQLIQRQNGPIGLLVLIASVIFQCRLFAAMLGKPDDSGRYLGFIGLAILSALGVGFSAILLIVPGLIVGARWLMSPAIFVGEGLGVTDALSASWQRTKGNTAPVVWAVLALFGVLIVLSIVAGVLIGLLSFIPFLAELVDAVAGEVFTVVLVAMSVSVYGLLSGHREELQNVFA
ncbi:MAG: hypothetical protein ABIT10_09575 [Alteraurantiacibacter sp.]